MKTMSSLQKLSKFLVLFLLLVSAALNAAETRWEVAIVFRSKQTDEAFQKDIDENILELARTGIKSSLKIGIYREMTSGSYTYLPAGNGKKEINLGDLLYRKDLPQIKIPGTLKKSRSEDLNGFLKSFYKDKASKKALIIYSHGKGAEGLNGLSTKDLKDALVNSAPRLDLLWFDACFMANLEFLFELRHLSDYTIASEEAEFSSGLPFQTLSLLPAFSTAKLAAQSLAKNFIESYSYLKNGKQRNYVSVSSATISVIENNKLEDLAGGMKEVSSLYKSLNDDQKNKIKKTLIAKSSMDEKTLVDLGGLLIELRKATKAADKLLTKLIRQLNIDSVKKLKTNPRIHLINPISNSILVYGFNNWQNGHREEFLNNELFTGLLANDGFIQGPGKTEWPFKKVSSAEVVLTPFAPGINVFNYYFQNAKGEFLSKSLSVSRTHDVVESLADSDLSPLIYTAYTQQLGSKAERYTGLNITMPDTVPTIDYFELEFNQLAEWLSL